VSATNRRRILFHQRLDPLLSRLVQERSRATPFAIVEGRSTFPAEAVDDRVDGSARTEKDSGDLSGRVAIRGKHNDMHPQAVAGFSLALHQADELLVLFGEEGDTLHLGGRSLWLTRVWCS
jgi:hypothetical protein